MVSKQGLERLLCLEISVEQNINYSENFSAYILEVFDWRKMPSIFL